MLTRLDPNYLNYKNKHIGSTCLARAIYVVRAVVLVNNNGILNIGHGSVLEKYIPNKTIARPPPRLDPQPILSANKCNRFSSHILHSRLIKILA